MTGVLSGHPVTLPFVTKRERLPNVSTEDLDRVHELVVREVRLEEELENVRAELVQHMTELRGRFPGRGTVTRIADTITAVRGDDVNRRTQVSRAVSTSRRATRSIRTQP